MQTSTFNLPYSGDVTQQWWTNPVTQATTSYFQQLGFININEVASTNRDMEEKIAREVAGYGQQLGWILETLVLLMDKLKQPIGQLTLDEQKKVMRLRNLLDDIENIRKSMRAS